MGMEHGAGCMVVRNIEDVDRYLGQVRDAAAKIHSWIAAQTGGPLDLLRRMKFETVGFHPIQVMLLTLLNRSIRPGRMSLPWLPPGVCWKCTRRQEAMCWLPAPMPPSTSTS